MGICSYLTPTVHKVGKLLNKKDKKLQQTFKKLHLKEIPVLPIATESKRKHWKVQKKLLKAFLVVGKENIAVGSCLRMLRIYFCTCLPTTI